eukprot:6478224-Amphidinium_carterae.1
MALNKAYMLAVRRCCGQSWAKQNRMPDAQVLSSLKLDKLETHIVARRVSFWPKLWSHRSSLVRACLGLRGGHHSWWSTQFVSLQMAKTANALLQPLPDPDDGCVREWVDASIRLAPTWKPIVRNL